MLTPPAHLWPPAYYTTAAQIEFWLDHPAISPDKAQATRDALRTYLPARVAKCWLDLYLYLGKARTAGPRPSTAEVTDFLEELRTAGVVEKEERLDLKPRLLKSTQAEFEWHCQRIRAAVQARQEELHHQSYAS